MPQDKDELLREFMDKYAKLYMKFAYANGVPFDDVEDVVMDAFWAFYNSDYFMNTPEEEMKAILARILKNKCIDYFRKNNRYESVDLDTGENELNLLYKSVCRDPADSAVLSEEARYACQCIEEMKDIWKEVAILYFIEGRRPAEISKMLNIPGTVCRSRIARAKEYLREKITAFRKGT